MGRVIGVRLARLLATLLAVTVLSFLLLNLVPGDPSITILGYLYATPANIARVHRDLGLDKPLPQRYADWVWGVLHGNWGQSYQTREGVLHAIMHRLPVTGELVLLTEVIAVFFAVIVAVISAQFHRSLFDRAGSGFTFALIAMPSFILGIFLIYGLAVKTGGWLPATGFVPISQGLGQNLRSLVLPAVTLAAPSAAVFTRVLRAEMLATLRQDYIAFAAAKGLPRWHVLLRHALRPSSLPLVTLVGIDLGVLIGGAFVVEQLFALPGIGTLLIQSIYRHDYLVVQGVVLFVTLFYVLVNFGVDVLYGVIDPRVRQKGRPV